MNHTPGPWRVSGSSPLHVETVSEEDGAIGNVFSFEEYDGNEADARLVAAAPDLLAALRYCASAITHAASGDGYTVSADEMMDLAASLAQARAVIAKAEGRS